MNQREQAAIADRIASLARRLVPEGSKTHSKGYTDLDAAAGLPIGWTGVTIDRLKTRAEYTFGIDKAISIARWAGVSLDWLLTGEERGMSPEIVEHVEALARALPERKGVRVAPEGGPIAVAPNAPKNAVVVASGRDENDLALAGGDDAPDPKPPHAPGGKGRKRKVVSR